MFAGGSPVEDPWGEQVSLDERFEYERGRRGAEGGEAVNDVLEVLDGDGADFEDEGVFAGAAIALNDLRHGVDALSEFGQDVANDAHANEGGDREADTRGVDLGTVGADDSFILHAANTFGDGRRGETHAPAKFCKGNAGISLERN